MASSRQYGNALLGVRHQEEEGFNQQSYSMSGLVSTWMGDCLCSANQSPRWPDQLSLVIPLWVGAMSTSQSWGDHAIH